MTSASPAPVLESSLAVPSSRDLDRLNDDELLARQREFAAVRRVADAGAARVAAEIERRSRRDLGSTGLAQREGVPTAARLIERVAGVTAGEARTLVAMGSLMSGQTAAPWFAAVAAAVEQGRVSLGAAQAITEGLGAPSCGVDADVLADLAGRLLRVAHEVPIRRLAAEARALRDQVDTAAIADREAAMRQRRFLRITPLDDGMTRVHGLLDPESAAIVIAAFDQVTSPRRNGPRFVDPAEASRAQRIVDDPRTTDQLVADAFVDIVRIAGSADPGRVFGQRRPAVQIHVERSDFDRGCGGAHLEGQTAAVSMATAYRIACTSGAVPILFDGVDAIDVGRAQRTFTERQRVALAARDGGCRWPGCDRPPSWTEAHHLAEWRRDGGETDLANGVLLCRFHHLRVHNLGWRIERRGSELVAIGPPGQGGAEIVLPSRDPIARSRLRKEARVQTDPHE